MKNCRILAVLFLLYSSSTFSGEWHNSFGIGIIDVDDELEDIHRSNLRAEGLDDSEFEAAMEVGYFYQPYYLYESGFAFGLGVGTPTGIIAEEIFFNIPFHVDVRYFLLGSDFGAYVRAGIRYNWAIGEYVEGSDPGAIAGIGILMDWNESAKVGIEFTDDSSEIEVRDIVNNRNRSINLNQSILSLIFSF